MAWARTRQVTPSGRWSCLRCYTVNPVEARFCSDCGLVPRGARVAAMPSPAEASRRRFIEIVPFVLFGVVAIGLLGLQLIR